MVFGNGIDGYGRFVVVAPPDGTAVMALVRPETETDEFQLVGRSGDVVFEDIATKYEEWRKRGVRFLNPPQKPPWGGRFTTFEDVDGNSLTLVVSDEFGNHLDKQRRSVAERLESERRAAQELEISKQVQARCLPQRQPP